MLACPSCGSVYTRSQEFCGLDGTRLAEVAQDPFLAKEVGRFIIEQLVGSGGMARVYRGRHAVLDRRVAIKVLHGELSADQQLARRFEREAKSLSRIRHPNVVEVLDFGRTEPGVLYMIMELVEGQTLGDALRRSGPVTPSEAARLVGQIANGLGAAHECGYIHRDLKPQNIILDIRTTPPAVKILDFGLVGLVEDVESDTPLTRQGSFFGTPSYMSPEQAAGERATPASDMYALGVVLYEMLTGSPPFTGDVRQLAQQHIQVRPPRPPLPYGGLSDVALRLLEKSPADRPTPRQLVDALARLELSLPPTTYALQDPLVAIDGPSARPEPPSAPSLAVPIERDEFSVLDGTSEIYEREALGPTRRSRWFLAMLLLLLLGVATFAVYRYDNRGPPPLDVSAAGDAGSAVDSAALERLARATPRRRSMGGGPTPGRPYRSASARAAIPSNGSAGAPPAATEAPDPSFTPEPVPRSLADPERFRLLDQELGRTLSERGLSFPDLEAVAPDATRQWGAWFRSPDAIEAGTLEPVYQTLVRAAKAVARGDRSVLERRLAEVQSSFRDLPDAVGGRERVGLRSRLRALERAIAKDPLEDPVRDIRSGLDLLAADLRAAAAAPQDPPPRPKGRQSAPETPDGPEGAPRGETREPGPSAEESPAPDPLDRSIEKLGSADTST